MGGSVRTGWGMVVALGLLFGGAGPVRAIELQWIGQDGHDSVGGHPGPSGNEFQDIHFKVRGLPANRKVVHVVIRGHGFGEWATDKVQGNFLVDVVRKPPNSTTADLYIEPIAPEAGREFEVHVRLDNGEDLVAYARGGKADPNLRAGGRPVSVDWLGPIPTDRVGPTAAVGSDGYEDIQLKLSDLPARSPVKSITLQTKGTGGAGLIWESGLNPKGHRNAEFTSPPGGPSRGNLLLAWNEVKPGQTLDLRILHEDGRFETATVTAKQGPAPRAMPRPALPDLRAGEFKVAWLGQDAPGGESGDVHLAIEGLEPGRKITAAALGDGVVGAWVTADAGSVWPGLKDFGERLTIVPQPQRPGTVELEFAPCRDEAGATMTLRLRDDRDRDAVVTFAGQSCDVDRRAPALPPGRVTARPGQDLQSLVDQNGTVHLAPGTYSLNRPLVLNRPTRIEGEPGAILRFQQPADAPLWTAAIKIHRGGTHLDQFAVRFAGPIRWDQAVSYGPAVIGTTDDRDGRPAEPRHAIRLTRLDLEAPPAATAPPAPWEPAPNLIRFNTAHSGRIEGNTLRGGTTLFEGGPWSIRDNRYLGTVPQTVCYDAFAAKYTHDLTLSGNRAEVAAGSGKTWRFLVLTQRGANDVVTDNQVAGIGTRDDDTFAHPNAPEILLTEAYRVHFEGKPAAISPGGRIVAIAEPQGDPNVGIGDAVSVLAGPDVGQWRRVALVLGTRMYLLDAPIDPNTPAVSISTGFVDETFRGNTVDVRGSTQAAAFVLAGNVFGVNVAGNRIQGGGESIRLVASATEQPCGWGWSHAPVLGAKVEGNTFEDGVAGLIGVEHSPYVKSSVGRTYLSAELVDNVVRRTRSAPTLKSDRPCLRVGCDPATDPATAIVTERGTRAEGVELGTAVRIHGRINGTVVRDSGLQPAPGP